VERERLWRVLDVMRPIAADTSCPSRRWRWHGCWRSRTSPR
jgi:hypothetical protein